MLLKHYMRNNHCMYVRVRVIVLYMLVFVVYSMHYGLSSQCTVEWQFVSMQKGALL